MSCKYRLDPDLEFFKYMDSKDFNDLVFVLTRDKNGKLRGTEELTLTKEYKQYNPDHAKYCQLIAAELQCFGGNTLANVVRGGQGVPYREILIDVCKRLKVKFDTSSKTEEIENALLMKMLQDAINQMKPEELKELAQIIGEKNLKAGLTPQALLAAGITAFKLGGFASYQLTVIVANFVWRAMFGRGLTFVGNAVLTRGMAVITGPIGWTVTGVWTLLDIASPAYRVTIPSVIQIALLRKKYLYGKEKEL